MSERTAKQLWTRMQACLPTHYRTLGWESLPQAVRSAMSQVVAELIQERDYDVIKSVRKQLLDEYTDWVVSEQSVAQLGYRIKTKRLEPPEV